MINKFIQWSDKSITNSIIGWLIILSLLYLLAYPLYYIVAAIFFLFFIGGGIFLLSRNDWKEKAFTNSMIGLTISFVITLYIGIKYIGSIDWWVPLIK